MRVYEIAKEMDVSSKEILKILKDAGFELASHMSVIPEDGIASIKKAFEKKTKKEEVAPAPVKVESKGKESVAGGDSELSKSSVHAEKRVSSKARVKVQERSVSKFNGVKGVFPGKDVSEISVSGDMPLHRVADLMGKPSGDLIFVLLRNGVVCNRNQILSVENIELLGRHFGIKVNLPNRSEEKESLALSLKKTTSGENRWPMVVVMGHVDHGKTTLLDFIRKIDTAAKEKGGITQHLGAYEVKSSHGKMVFLDTPGHEAFSYLRSQGAKVTDIAVLIVAADDGVKPQTVEAIKHAKESQVPIIVAVNKVDKVDPDHLTGSLQKIQRELAENDVLVEDWGGDIICVPISAKTGKGVDELLEMIVLQAQMMELKANKEKPARAFVLESNLERGFGTVATIISLEGTIKKGDYFVCGSSTGRVRLLINSFGEKINQAGPSVPVKVVGFDSSEGIGTWLNVVTSQEYKKARSEKAVRPQLPQAAPLGTTLEEGVKGINLIIRTDTRGSKEAIEGSIKKLSKLTKKDCAPINIVASGIGGVSEKDVELAETTGSQILGLHVKTEKKALLLAKNKKISIKSFDIIYHLVEYLEEIVEKTRKIEKVWKKSAQLLVKRVFDIKKIGIVAGCSVQEGTVSNGNKVVCVRGGQQVGEGFIKSLQRENKVVKEVHAGFECGFICDGFQGWQENDIVQCFYEVKASGEK